MAKVLIPIPARDFDPTEVTIPWRILTRMGHEVAFATPDGRPGAADAIMLTGQGLDPWGWIPGLKRLPLIGRALRAGPEARQAYAAMAADAAFRQPRRWDAVEPAVFDGLILPGGHRARGMTEYLESPVVQALTLAFFQAGKPVGAICHGVLVAARSRDPATGHSVLHGRRTTALTWSLERSAARLGRFARFWDPGYYRTYRDGPGEPAGYMSVQQEVTRALADPADFRDVPADAPDRARKTSGLARDSEADAAPAFVVVDGPYVSARWPGDAHLFARTFAELLPRAIIADAAMIHVPTAPWTHNVFDLAGWAAGAAVGLVLYRWRLAGRVRQMAGVTGPGYFLSLAAGAAAGAWAAGSLNTLQGPAPVLSHSVAGALVGAIVAVEIYKLARGIRGSTGAVFVGSFATGVVVGRWGCLFAGLPDRTYGVPTTLPWGVELGDGVPRHPVQVYESLAMALFLAVYVWGLARRAPWAMRRGFYLLCIWYGAQRFAWEFLKPYPAVVGPFNLFHLLCAGLVIYGVVYFLRDLADERAAHAEIRALSVPRPDHEPV